MGTQKNREIDLFEDPISQQFDLRFSEDGFIFRFFQETRFIA
jgi:hypothetical protein